MPVGTPITTKVAVKDVKTAYDSKGGGYYSTVTFEDGVVLKLLHQSPSMQSKVKGGASTGTYGSYIAQDKAEAKSEQEIETLRANYYSLGEKDEADHIKRVKDLRKNGLNYMNRTGELPFQREYLAMKSQYLGSTQPDLNAQKFKDGGLVGNFRIGIANVDRGRFDAIQNNPITSSSQPNIVINNNAQTNVSARQGSDGRMYVTIDEVEDWFNRSMQNPNSKPRKSMQQNTTAQPRRR